MTPEEEQAKKIRIELGLYGDSIEEINRETQETGAVPLLKLAKTPLTILCHTGDVNVNDAGTFKIDTESCMQQAEWSYAQKKFMPGIEVYLKMFDYEPKDILYVEHPTKQHKKIVGIIELTIGALRMAKHHNKRIPLFFEEPEIHLHPKYHGPCIQFLIAAMKEFGLEVEIKE